MIPNRTVTQSRRFLRSRENSIAFWFCVSISTPICWQDWRAWAKQHKIKNAVILSGIGAVRGYHVHTVSNRTFPSKNVFIKDPTAPADLTSINGYVIDGRVHCRT